MHKAEITCDGCGANLYDAGAMPTYRLTLTPEAVANSGNIIYSVAVRPDIDRSYHFCFLVCLDHWRGRERHRDGLWRGWLDNWKEKLGTKGENGRIVSYPCPTDEDQKVCRAEFEAAALAAFPMIRPPR